MADDDRYLVVTEGRHQRLELLSSEEAAIDTAAERIEKNQVQYAGARRPHRYAVVKLVCWVSPKPPRLDVEVTYPDD